MFGVKALLFKPSDFLTVELLTELLEPKSIVEMPPKKNPLGLNQWVGCAPNDSASEHQCDRLGFDRVSHIFVIGYLIKVKVLIDFFAVTVDDAHVCHVLLTCWNTSQA